MHSSRTAIEITLHLTDGRLVLFSQPEGVSSSDLFEGAALSSVFNREVLVLRGDQSVSLFPTGKIVRLDVSRLPDESQYVNEPIQADQIADYDFQWLRETLAAVQVQFPEARRIEDVIVAADVELCNAEHLYLRVEFKKTDSGKTPQQMLVDQILHSGGLMVRLREGGFGIINPRSLVRLTLFPVPETCGTDCSIMATG